MISDTLAEAICDIDRYLEDYPETYSGDLRELVLAIREHMDKLRAELDTPPPAYVPPKVSIAVPKHQFDVMGEGWKLPEDVAIVPFAPGSLGLHFVPSKPVPPEGYKRGDFVEGVLTTGKKK